MEAVRFFKTKLGRCVIINYKIKQWTAKKGRIIASRYKRCMAKKKTGITIAIQTDPPTPDEFKSLGLQLERMQTINPETDDFVNNSYVQFKPKKVGFQKHSTNTKLLLQESFSNLDNLDEAIYRSGAYKQVEKQIMGAGIQNLSHVAKGGSPNTKYLHALMNKDDRSTRVSSEIEQMPQLLNAKDRLYEDMKFQEQMGMSSLKVNGKEFKLLKFNQKTVKMYETIIKLPKNSDQILLKPPFRFIHDLFSETCKVTGYGYGLFTGWATNSRNFAEFDERCNYFNKMIYLTELVLGEEIDVNGSKMVAGKQADKTNAFLQKMFAAATSEKSSKQFVKIVNKRFGIDDLVQPAHVTLEESNPKVKLFNELSKEDQAVLHMQRKREAEQVSSPELSDKKSNALHNQTEQRVSFLSEKAHEPQQPQHSMLDIRSQKSTGNDKKVLRWHKHSGKAIENIAEEAAEAGNHLRDILETLKQNEASKQLLEAKNKQVQAAIETQIANWLDKDEDDDA